MLEYLTYISKNITTINIYFYISTLVLGLIILLFDYLFYKKSYFNPLPNFKSDSWKLFCKEFLKTKFESINNIELSEDRINEIKNNFISDYYNLDIHDNVKYINKNIRISKKLNDNNYISIIDKWK